MCSGARGNSPEVSTRMCVFSFKDVCNDPNLELPQIRQIKFDKLKMRALRTLKLLEQEMQHDIGKRRRPKLPQRGTTPPSSCASIERGGGSGGGGGGGGGGNGGHGGSASPSGDTFGGEGGRSSSSSPSSLSQGHVKRGILAAEKGLCSDGGGGDAMEERDSGGGGGGGGGGGSFSVHSSRSVVGEGSRGDDDEEEEEEEEDDDDEDDERPKKKKRIDKADGDEVSKRSKTTRVLTWRKRRRLPQPVRDGYIFP